MRRLALIAMLTLATMFALPGCRGSGSNTKVPPPPAKVYYCPDHPQCTGAKGDRCKLCNQALVERPVRASTQPSDD